MIAAAFGRARTLAGRGDFVGKWKWHGWKRWRISVVRKVLPLAVFNRAGKDGDTRGA